MGLLDKLLGVPSLSAQAVQQPRAVQPPASKFTDGNRELQQVKAQGSLYNEQGLGRIAAGGINTLTPGKGFAPAGANLQLFA